MKLELRWYQQEAVDALLAALNDGHSAPYVSLPTGAGKSLVIAGFIKTVLANWPGLNILVCAHSKELVDQNSKELKAYAPHISFGVYSAGLGKRQLKQVTFASVQSVWNKKPFHGRFDIIIIDECHAVSRKEDSMYYKLIANSYANNQDLRLIGLSASPYRLDSGMVHEGDDAIFDCLAYEAPMVRLMEEGFLCRLTSKHGDNVDLSGIRTTAGEYNLGQLGERMSAMELIEHHADLMMKLCADRGSWLVFCVTVEHASRISAVLSRRGVACTYVSGDMPDNERDSKINAFRNGELRALVNCNILTTGFNVRQVDAVVMLRPTLSPGLYIQMAGRGLRTHPSKTNCLIVDCGGNVRRHGFIDKVTPPRKGKKGPPQEAPVKECPKCAALVAIMTKTCECGHVFPIAEREAEKAHHVGAILSTEIPPVQLKVDQVRYTKHTGKSGVPTLRVTYYCGMRSVAEYVCLEHAGYARTKAVTWWNTRCPDRIAPRMVDQALELTDELATPSSIIVSFVGKYPEIRSHQFDVAEIET
jgi:DNA repair protein RadD